MSHLSCHQTVNSLTVFSPLFKRNTLAVPARRCEPSFWRQCLWEFIHPVTLPFLLIYLFTSTATCFLSFSRFPVEVFFSFSLALRSNSTLLSLATFTLAIVLPVLILRTTNSVNSIMPTIHPSLPNDFNFMQPNLSNFFPLQCNLLISCFPRTSLLNLCSCRLSFLSSSSWMTIECNPLADSITPFCALVRWVRCKNTSFPLNSLLLILFLSMSPWDIFPTTRLVSL